MPIIPLADTKIDSGGYNVAHMARTPGGKNLKVVYDVEVSGSEGSTRQLLLNDVQLQERGSAYPVEGLDDVVEGQLDDLLLEEFAGTLSNTMETQRQYGMKISLLLEQRLCKKESPLELLGFLAYKPWGLPTPGVSIGAIGVMENQRGKGYGRRLMEVAEEKAALAAAKVAGGSSGEVYLRSIPSAVTFYERLGYERIEEDDSADTTQEESRARLGLVTVGCCDPEAPRTPKNSAKQQQIIEKTDNSDEIVDEKKKETNGEKANADVDETTDDEDGPCVPMARRLAPFTPGTAARAGPMTPKLDPRTPNRSRAFEDGPTWPPNPSFSLGPSAVLQEEPDDVEDT